MNIDMKPYLQQLQGRETVSIPDLQLSMKCSYAQAREAMEQLRQSGLVSSVIQGISSAVNVKLRDRRGMTLEQARAVVSNMAATEIMTLSIVYDALPRGGFLYSPQTDEDGEIRTNLDSLSQMQLIHAFDGRVFPSIDDQAWEHIKKVDQDKINEPTIILLAIPALERAFALKDDPLTFYELCLIPEVCKDFVSKSYAEFLKTGEKPNQLTEKLVGLSEYKCHLSLEMLHAVLAAHPALESTASYVRVARMSARKMRGMDLWEDVVYDAADEAIQMLSELSIEEIRSLQKAQNEEDDDW